ncbi:MAG: adenylate kinase family protein [Thermoplasmatota archaeon]
MKTAVTGTPGTGKSTVAAGLAERGYAVLCFSDLAASHVCGRDVERDCDVVDVAAVDEAFQRQEGDLVVEGHLSHLLSVDQAVVLRCHPDVLAARLREKGWSSGKIAENVEAEALDVILDDALERHGEEHVAQIDTTDRAAGEIVDMVAGLHDDGIAAGAGDTVDWSAWLVEYAG